jgi:hypothetical protein
VGQQVTAEAEDIVGPFSKYTSSRELTSDSCCMTYLSTYTYIDVSSLQQCSQYAHVLFTSVGAEYGPDTNQ